MAARRIGRLFWKLLLALWLSMVLSFLGTLAYITLIGRPPPPDDVGSFGFIPLVPLISAMAAVLIIGPVLAWYLSRPLRHLRWALRRAAEGKFDTRVQPLMGGRRDEIADLAQEFDNMALQLQQMTASRQVLFHDISHELRSPLSRLQAAIGLLRQDPSSTEAMVERIEVIRGANGLLSGAGSLGAGSSEDPPQAETRKMALTPMSLFRWLGIVLLPLIFRGRSLCLRHGRST